MRELVLKLLENVEMKRDFGIERLRVGSFIDSEDLHQEIGRLNATHEFIGELKRIIGEDDQHVH